MRRVSAVWPSSMTIILAVLVCGTAGRAYAQAPGPASPGVAAGALVGDRLTFTWGAVSTATWYLLHVTDSTGQVRTQWFSAAEAGCASTPVCSGIIDAALPSGDMSWWVRTYNGLYGPWSAEQRVRKSAFLQTSTQYGNVYLGVSGPQAANTGHLNTAVGDYALAGSTTGDFNTAIGGGTLRANTSGLWNTAIGAHALSANTTGRDNTAVGTFALYNSGIANRNTAVGVAALYANTSGNDNAAFGHNALAANIGGRDNTAVGRNALKANTAATYNVAVGRDALMTTQTGGLNVAVGYQALLFNTAGANTAVGSSALASNQTGEQGTAVGFASLLNTTTGDQNTAIGAYAGGGNQIGNLNVAVGHAALRYANTNGNTAVGAGALLNATGTSNTGIGYLAGRELSSGSNNIMINHVGLAADANTTRIGTDGMQLRAFVAGVYASTVSTRQVYVNADGQLGTTSSSRTTKRNIADLGDASARIFDLRPVSFKYLPSIDPAGDTQYGLIAEEVAGVLPELVDRGTSGEPETVRYHLLAPMLLNELQKTRSELQKTRADLDAATTDLRELKARLAALEALAQQK